MAASEDIFLGVAVTLRSLGERLAAGWSVRVHLFAPDGNGRRRLADSLVGLPVELVWHAPSHRLSDVGPTTTWPHHDLTYQRVFAADDLPSLDRFVYLDADLLVRHSLHGLLAAAGDDGPGDRPLAWAVNDSAVPFVASASGVGAWSRLGLDPLQPYFNAGVLVVDAERWRHDRVADAVVEHVAGHGATMTHNDQEALNATVGRRWRAVPPAWNRQVGFGPLAQAPVRPLLDIDDITAAETDPHVVHFIGPRKPWVAGVRTAWTDEWWDVAGRTAWHDSRRPRTPLRARGRAAVTLSRSAVWQLLRAP